MLSFPLHMFLNMFKCVRPKIIFYKARYSNSIICGFDNHYNITSEQASSHTFHGICLDQTICEEGNQKSIENITTIVHSHTTVIKILLEAQTTYTTPMQEMTTVFSSKDNKVTTTTLTNKLIHLRIIGMHDTTPTLPPTTSAFQEWFQYYCITIVLQRIARYCNTYCKISKYCNTYCKISKYCKKYCKILKLLQKVLLYFAERNFFKGVLFFTTF